MEDYNFLRFNWDYLYVRGFNETEFVTCVQKSFVRQYVKSPIRDGAVLNIILGSKTGLVVEMSVGQYFVNSYYNSGSFKLAMERDNVGPQVKI